MPKFHKNEVGKSHPFSVLENSTVEKKVTEKSYWKKNVEYNVEPCRALKQPGCSRPEVVISGSCHLHAQRNSSLLLRLRISLPGTNSYFVGLSTTV